jgi:hypothetical protein
LEKYTRKTAKWVEIVAPEDAKYAKWVKKMIETALDLAKRMNHE